MTPLEIMAQAMQEHNRIQQTADCLAAGYEIPKHRTEFKFYDEMTAEEKKYVTDIARAQIAALEAAGLRIVP